MSGEALFGLCGKDFVILVADMHASTSIIRTKDNLDKMHQVGNMLIATAGPCSDTNNFVEFIDKNIRLNNLRTGGELTTRAAANFTRNEIAQALRSGPYQVDMLFAGCDASGPQLYFIDYLASMQKCNKAAHGYGAYFALGLMDRYYKADLTLDEAKEIMRLCIKEMETRFVLHMSKFKCKVVDKNGVREEPL
jgi:20S proteasome subunit beta 4